MEYLTSFYLEIKSKQEVEAEHFITELQAEVDGAREAFQENGYTKHRTVWTSYETDLAQFSKRYPEVVFCLYGYGEAVGDIWVTYFKNGQSQYEEAIVSFPDFDERFLDDVILDQ